jgi:O-antigen/teichoic acid export membrane protein
VTVPQNLRRLTRHSAIYGLGDLVARLLGVLLLPLYAAYLSPADHGKI